MNQFWEHVTSSVSAAAAAAAAAAAGSPSEMRHAEALAEFREPLMFKKVQGTPNNIVRLQLTTLDKRSIMLSIARTQ